GAGGLRWSLLAGSRGAVTGGPADRGGPAGGQRPPGPAPGPAWRRGCGRGWRGGPAPAGAGRPGHPRRPPRHAGPGAAPAGGRGGGEAAYANEAGDDAVVEDANAGRRILLTQDRGLLRRRALWLGAYVYGAPPDDQPADVLDRFTPLLAPWTRCPACNGLLCPVPKAAGQPLLQPRNPGTGQACSRCGTCGQVYWRGAHSKRLEALIASAQRAVHTVTRIPSNNRTQQGPAGEHRARP